MSVIDPVPVPAPPGRSTTKTVLIAALALAVTFAAGFVVGAVVDRVLMFHHRPPHIPPMAAAMMLHRLDRHLDLTDQQRHQIEQILERRHARIEQLVSGVRPQVDKEIDETNAEIERVLTPGQRAKFQELKIRMGPRMHHGDRERKGPTR